MEEKLKAYRAKKRRQQIFNNIKNYILSMVSFQQIGSSTDGKKEERIIIETDQNEEKQTNRTSDNPSDTGSITSQNTQDSDQEDSNIEANTKIPQKRKSFLVYVTYLIYVLFWATCYAIAIELGFGLVFLTISILFGIYFNTRTGPKNENEISAYSVFNKDFKSIDGTLKGEQFDKEIRYGASSVR